MIEENPNTTKWIYQFFTTAIHQISVPPSWLSIPRRTTCLNLHWTPAQWRSPQPAASAPSKPCSSSSNLSYEKRISTLHHFELRRLTGFVPTPSQTWNATPNLWGPLKEVGFKLKRSPIFNLMVGCWVASLRNTMWLSTTLSHSTPVNTTFPSTFYFRLCESGERATILKIRNIPWRHGASSTFAPAPCEDLVQRCIQKYAHIPRLLRSRRYWVKRAKTVLLFLFFYFLIFDIQPPPRFSNACRCRRERID